MKGGFVPGVYDSLYMRYRSRSKYVRLLHPGLTLVYVGIESYMYSVKPYSNKTTYKYTGMVKLQRNEDQSSAKISVPLSIVRLKGWEDKEELEWKEKRGNLVLQEK